MTDESSEWLVSCEELGLVLAWSALQRWTSSDRAVFAALKRARALSTPPVRTCPRTQRPGQSRHCSQYSLSSAGRRTVKRAGGARCDRL